MRLSTVRFLTARRVARKAPSNTTCSKAFSTSILDSSKISRFPYSSTTTIARMPMISSPTSSLIGSNRNMSNMAAAAGNNLNGNLESNLDQSSSNSSIYSNSDLKDINPLITIQDAIESLNDFSTRLQQLATTIDQFHEISVTIQEKDNETSNETDSPLILPSDYKQSSNKNKTKTLHAKVRLGDIVLHSRDSTQADYDAPVAQAAREAVLPLAKQVATDLTKLFEEYTQTLVQKMETATTLCQETPCGGTTWEIENGLDQWIQYKEKETASTASTSTTTTTTTTTTTPNGNQTISLNGMEDTPCGRLQLASLNFLQTTLDTKSQIFMGSRAHLILDLSMTMFDDTPLLEIRKNGTTEQNKTIRQIFQNQCIPTPWIRSDAEYQELLEIQKQL